MELHDWLEMTAPERAALWQKMTPEERHDLFTKAAAQTPNYGWPYPQNYSDPADSPSAFRALALAVDTTMATKQATTAAESAYVRSPTGTVVTDWNAALKAGFYRSVSGTAENTPADSLGIAAWMGWVVQSTDGYVHQILVPSMSGTQKYPDGTLMQRTNIGGTWGPWSRVMNWSYSWAAADNFLTRMHGLAKVPRFAEGFKKDPASTSPTAMDEWRCQCYSPTGEFTWSAIKIPESGVVSMPRTTTVTTEALTAGEGLHADTVVTVGSLLALLGRLGVDLGPVAALVDHTPLLDEEGR